MNTTAAQTVATAASQAAARQRRRVNPVSARASSLALAAVLTLAMLAGVDTLAVVDGATAQQPARLAQGHAPQG